MTDVTKPLSHPEPIIAEPSIQTRVVRGATALAVRQVVVGAVTLGGNVLLSRLLSPEDFGVWAVLQLCMQFIYSFGNAGLAPSLVRQPDVPTEHELSAVFTIQQLLVAALLAITLPLAPELAKLFHMASAGTFAIRVVSLSLLCASVQMVPMVHLERALSFDRMATIEVAQNVSFYVTACLFAWRGFGGNSFGYALLCRAALGAVFANWMRPWMPHWTWAPREIWHHLRYGLALQGAQLISLAKDSISPLLIGALLGLKDLGLVNWGNTTAIYGIFLLTPFSRLYMPVFARLQHDTKSMSDFLEKTVFASNAITSLVSIPLLVLAVPLTTLVFGAKWLDALPVFRWLWLANLFIPTFLPLTAVLQALGKVRIPLIFAIIWAIATWIFCGPLIVLFGKVGFGMGNALVQLTNVAILIYTRRYVKFRLLPSAGVPWAIGAGVGLCIALLQWVAPARTVVQLGIYGALSAALQLAILATVKRHWAGRFMQELGWRKAA